MPKTINALIEDEIGELRVNEQQRLIDAGLYREAISVLSESAEEGSIRLFAKNDNNPDRPDIDWEVDEESIDEARHQVTRAVRQTACFSNIDLKNQ